MGVYGEGLYRASDGRAVEPPERTREQLERREWELAGLEPAPTPETKRLGLSSIYALTKYDQERACLVCGAAYGIPAVALRLFNTYGTRQALSNPYTGVLAIFASRLLNDRAPRIFEDGLQRRDFVSVRDVARSFRLALEHDGADGTALNVGSGRSVTVREIGEQLGATVGKQIEPEVTGEYRVGDIRHCYADITLARGRLATSRRSSSRAWRSSPSGSRGASPTIARRCRRRVAGAGLLVATPPEHEQPGGGLLRDRALAVVEADRTDRRPASGCASRSPAWYEPLVRTSAGARRRFARRTIVARARPRRAMRAVRARGFACRRPCRRASRRALRLSRSSIRSIISRNASPSRSARLCARRLCSP
jgi:hypothetical protein